MVTMYCLGRGWVSIRQDMRLMRKKEQQGRVLPDNVWIGAGVHIDCGVAIGDNSIIGAGSVITRDIPANVVAAGVPCRVIRQISGEEKTDYFDILRTEYRDTKSDID